MKKLTKLLAPSIALFMASLIAITGATYAWFQTSTQGTVEQINANVVEAQGMEVSWTGEDGTWKSGLTFADNEYTNTAAYTQWKQENSTFKFKPVSTNGVVSGEKFSFFTANPTDNQITGIAAVNNTDAYYPAGLIYFKVYIRVATDTNITLGSGMAAANGETGATTSITDTNTSIALASRLGVLYNGYKATGATEWTKTNATSLIWEPNATKHTTTAKTDAGLALDTTTDLVYPYYAIKAAPTNTATAIDRMNKLQLSSGAIDFAGSQTANADYLARVSTKTEINDMDFSLKAGINELAIFFWVEGQDHDCLNDLSNTNMVLTLRFDVAAAA